MKVINRKVLIRRYHISLMVFLLALGLVPASLISNAASAETERAATEKLNEQIEEAKDTETVVSEVKVTDIVEDFAVYEPVYEVAEARETYETYEVFDTPSYDRIDIAGNSVPIFYSSDTLIDSGGQAGLYGEHFIYGHNTANVFGGVANLEIGDYFTVTLSGTTKTYQIVSADLQTKTHFEGDVVRKTTMSGMTIMTTMKMMKAITAYGEYNGNYYDYILMTCAGTSYGNGDASHRLILMANEV